MSTKKLQILGSLGASSWNDLTDRPFGETVVGGDTLTWDGNTDGLLCVMDELYKVSDAVPPIERIAANSVTVRYPDGLERKFEFTDSNIQIYDTNAGFPAGFAQISLTASDDQDLAVFTIVGEDFVGVDLMGASFPEAGVYVFPNEYFTPVSLTIPGYTGFQTKTVKPLDEKYLPDTVQRTITGTAGQFVVIGDDGNVTTKDVAQDTVRYTEQTLTEDQQLQARTNIGIIEAGEPEALELLAELEIASPVTDGDVIYTDEQNNILII